MANKRCYGICHALNRQRVGNIYNMDEMKQSESGRNTGSKKFAIISPDFQRLLINE